MNTSNTDRELVAWVQRQINTGARRIIVPGDLLTNASRETVEEVRRLCQLNGVSIEVRA